MVNLWQIRVDKKVNVYDVKNKNIMLYNCDIFDFFFKEFGGQFDVIWDQFVMFVINVMGKKWLKEYMSLMQVLLKLDGCYMVEICKYGVNFVIGKMLKLLVGDKSDVCYIGMRMWKYDEDEFEEDEEEDGGYGDYGYEDYGYEDYGYGDYGDDEEEVEMFYYIIIFK